MKSAFELWKFDSLSDPRSARSAKGAAKEPDPAVAINQAREAARIDGYQAGLLAGRAEGMRLAELDAVRLRALLESFRSALDGLQVEVADALLGLAMDVARQIMRHELESHPESILPAIREAMEMGGNGAGPQLLLNPKDVPFVKEHLAELLGADQWRVLEDSSIEPGGCRVVTANGSIDATLATRWQRVVSALGSNDAW